MSFQSPIIRVSRKRSADPHTALVVEIKRQKNDQILFSLFKTSEAKDIDMINANAVIDFPSATSERSSIDEQNPLSFANNSVGEIGGPSSAPNIEEDVITVNGRPLISAPVISDDIVYDFYKIVRGEVENFHDDFNDWDMRIATREEAMLVFEDNDSSDDAADDNDDSNDENNWRNDYPDESDGHPDDTESERETWDEDYSSNGEDGDGLRLRMQRFGIGSDNYSDDGYNADE